MGSVMPFGTSKACCCCSPCCCCCMWCGVRTRARVCVSVCGVCSPLICTACIHVFVCCCLLLLLQEMGAYRLYTVVPFLIKFIDQLTNIYVSGGCWRLVALQHT
jgi:hypothetical protein